MENLSICLGFTNKYSRCSFFVSYSRHGFIYCKDFRKGGSTKKNSIFEHIVEKSKRKIKTEIKTYEKLLKDEFKDLRNYLTQTNASEEGTKDISIENNIARYSQERTSLILTSLNSIENKLLELKVLINKM